MGTPWGPKYIPYTYMDPLGLIPRVNVRLKLLPVLSGSYAVLSIFWKFVGLLARDLGVIG